MTCCTVHSEPHELDLVRMQLSADIRVFTEANKVCSKNMICFFLLNAKCTTDWCQLWHCWHCWIFRFLYLL